MAYKDRKSRKLFVETWKGRGYEKGETQQFWLSLLTNVLGYEHNDTVLFEHHVSTGGFIDVWIRQSDVMIEQKSIDVDLDKPEIRQGELKTPLQQVQDYAASLPLTEQPKYLITCNFETFRIYDRTRYGDAELKDNLFDFTLSDLIEHPEYLSCIVDPNNSRLRKEKDVSEQAGRLVGELYDMLLNQYNDPDSEETQHSLNVLCVRLVFCLFCEDEGLFGEPDAFCSYLAKVDPTDIRMKLQHLFDNLDTPYKDRDKYDNPIKVFPYVNGGLFSRKEKIVIPPFTQEIKDFLIEKMALPVNWSNISPTIFGGIFESTLNPETRRKSGMHYTTLESIHKVIDTLFLNELKDEFEAIRTDDTLSVIKKRNRYRKFHEKLCSLVFFDPACGSGNFLTETYICLRRLEYAVLKEYKSKQMSMFDSATEGEIELRIKLDQFYGIEINDFAVAVAETALWISRLKANQEYLLLLDLDENDFPLMERANIICDNALRFDWNDLVEPSRVSYIIGNPPFVGYKLQDSSQKEDLRRLFKDVKTIDYVAGWYYKAAEYIQNHDISVAFVSTNSVVQGEQVNAIWSNLLKFDICINFAYRTFPWDSEAAVYCVIIGFSHNRNKPCLLYDEKGNCHIVNHINYYLVDADDIFIEKRSTPLVKAEKMIYGSEPREGGFLILSEEQRKKLLLETPASERFIKRFVSADDFLYNKMRYCLWFSEVSDLNEIKNSAIINERLESCRSFREKSKQAQAHAAATTPYLFSSPRQPDTDYLLIPIVTSENRSYIPVGYMNKDVILSNACFSISNASFYTFGILCSSIHMSWVSTVCGRLESRFRYSNTIVYNNFPWPTPTDEHKSIIEQTAQGILNARDLYPDKNLADLYDPDKMPTELKIAHEANDKAVMDAYGFAHDMTEPEIVAELMKMYQELTRVV